jgi:hypothetical protein
LYDVASKAGASTVSVRREAERGEGHTANHVIDYTAGAYSLIMLAARNVRQKKACTKSKTMTENRNDYSYDIAANSMAPIAANKQKRRNLRLFMNSCTLMACILLALYFMNKEMPEQFSTESTTAFTVMTNTGGGTSRSRGTSTIEFPTNNNEANQKGLSPHSKDVLLAAARDRTVLLHKQEQEKLAANGKLPPLESLIDTATDEIQADAQFLLDFAGKMEKCPGTIECLPPTFGLLAHFHCILGLLFSFGVWKMRYHDIASLVATKK